MTSNKRLALLFLLLTGTACGRGSDAGQQSIREDPDASFSAFASVLHDHLENEPIDVYKPDVGLFGDLSVTSGESISMGRYRYMTDMSGTEPQARMAFLVRENGTRMDPIPVTLLFVARDGQWQLEDASRGADGSPSNPFEAALAQHFNSWISAAVERAKQDRPLE